MNQKRKYKTYSKEFKEEAVSLVTDQGYSVAEAAEAVGVNPSQIYNWKKQQEEQADVTKISTLLGYAPTFVIDEGIAEAMPWYMGYLKTTH